MNHDDDDYEPTTSAAFQRHERAHQKLYDLCSPLCGLAGHAGQAALAYLLACGALLDQPLLRTGASTASTEKLAQQLNSAS